MPSARQAFDRSLSLIQVQTQNLGTMVVDAVEESMASLEAHDAARALGVVQRDADVNELRFQIESACLSTIATQQPAAGDLRQLIAALNVVTDLERIGDYAAGIAKAYRRMDRSDLAVDIPSDLLGMSELSLTMLRAVLEAYDRRDASAAHAIALQDNKMDERYQALFDDFLGLMARPGTPAEAALYLLFIGHNLERIADRVTNIAERVVFMMSGEMHELNPERSEPGGLE